MSTIHKRAAYKSGYCEHCAAFFNYHVLKTSKDTNEVKDKIRKSGPAHFLCGVTLPPGKKHFCTLAYKYPSVFERFKKEHRLIPGKHLDLVNDVFFK